MLIDWLTDTTGVPGLHGRPLGGTVTRAGLDGRDLVVGDQLDVGAHDAGPVGGQNHGAVHLRQLTQAGRRELHVELEAAVADLFHLLVVTEDDQAPVRPRRMRSRPSRSAVPGASRAIVSRSADDDSASFIAQYSR